jgi:NAD(P)-dependent dehydrogenase (short-subunit alcohol dehydrogenase family)
MIECSISSAHPDDRFECLRAEATLGHPFGSAIGTCDQTDGGQWLCDRGVVCSRRLRRRARRPRQRRCGENARLSAQEGANAVTVVADVRNAQERERLVHEANEQLGGLDGLVANVGYGAGGGLSDTTPEIWDDVFAVNVRSHFLTARAACHYLLTTVQSCALGPAPGCLRMTRRRPPRTVYAGTWLSRAPRAAFGLTT